MTKVITTNVGSLIDATTAQTTINTNTSNIASAIENTLSRDGTTPNQMQASLDMNSNRVLNLPAPSSQQEPVRLMDFITPVGPFAPLNSPTFVGVPTAPTPAVNDNSIKLATTAYVIGQAGTVIPSINGIGTVGTSTKFSREDHIHPFDPSLSFVTASTMAALRAFTAPVSATRVYLDGYFSAADVGEGWFEYNTTSAENDNSGTVI